MPMAYTMNRRSRGGCIDCRKSKVKCDEIRPFCGTCTRRRHVCQGYATAASPQADSAKSRAASKPTPPGKVSPSIKSEESTVAKSPFSRFDEVTTFSGRAIPKAGHPLVMDPALLPPRALSLIPPGIVNPKDEASVDVYFKRHPFELLMGPEFVDEMNGNVLIVLQHNPKAILHSLSGIGHSYLTDSVSESSLTVLNHRARILATLREMEHSKCELEDMVVLFLGLCAMELVDAKTAASETTIPAIIANSAALINHHTSGGRNVSSLAKYFIRALARQDIIISLAQSRRIVIPTSVWLDDETRTSADRLMGYTTTLMPLLEELCALSEDIRTLQSTDSRPVASPISGDTSLGSHSSQPLALPAPNPVYSDCLQRAKELEVRIKLWSPQLPHGLSFQTSRRFLTQATAYRSGALLYIFRLLNPPGLSPEVDGEAVAKAHQIILSTTGPSEELKLLLWPAFLASCEMTEAEDRAVVLNVFDAILTQRRTVTAQRTKSFVVNRVWRARDNGRDWNWGILARQFPGECMPI